MYKVMLTDDEESLHVSIEKLLTHAGYEYCGARDAESGLEMLATEKPDLVLLDVMLPGMNGFDLCSRIRAEGRHIPARCSRAAKFRNISGARARPMCAAIPSRCSSVSAEPPFRRARPPWYQRERGELHDED